MKRRMTILFLLTLVVIVAFYGVAISGSGREDPNCNCLPQAKTGPVITGPFTVARDLLTWNTNLTHYDFQAVLKKGSEVHLYSFQSQVDNNVNICYIPVEGPGGIKENFKREACFMGIGEAFGYSGIPVISDLIVQHTDNCDNLMKAMIAGDLVIRVEPPCQAGDPGCDCIQ